MECALPPGGQCSLAMDPTPAPVEVINLSTDAGASVLGYWLYSAQCEPRRVSAVINHGEALIFSPPKGGNGFPARTLVLFNNGTAPLRARIVK